MEKFTKIKKTIETTMQRSVAEFDLEHSKMVLKWVLELKPDADMALQISAMGHDIDRCFKPEGRMVERKNFIDKDGKEDYGEYKRQHALRSAEILIEILQQQEFDVEIIKKVKELVEKHEVGGDTESDVLKDADSLAFFEDEIPYYFSTHTPKQTEDKIKFAYNRLSDNAKSLSHKIKLEDKEANKLFHNTINNL